MASNINDLYKGRMQGVSPEQLQKIAMAKAAQGKLGSFSNGPSMQAALRSYEGSPLKVRGQGASAAAPSILEGLGQLVQRRQGKSKLNEMEQQSQALRGEISEGYVAEQRAKLGAQDYQNTIDAQKWQRGNEQKIIDEKRQSEAKMQEFTKKRLIESNDFVGDYKPWVNADGEQTNYVRTKGNKMLDENGQVGSTEGSIPLSEWNKQKEISVADAGNISAGGKKDARAHLSQLADIRDVNKMADGLTDEDLVHFQGNNVLQRALTESITPEGVANWVRENAQGLSPAAQEYVTRLTTVSAKIRHDLYGSQLTKPELIFSNAIMPSAADLTMAQQRARLKGFASGNMNALKAIDDTEGSSLYNLAEKEYSYTQPTKKTAFTYDDDEKESRYQLWQQQQ